MPLGICAAFDSCQDGTAEGGIGTGAPAFTVGMISTCFLYPVAGHRFLEKQVRHKVPYPPFVNFDQVADLLMPRSSGREVVEIVLAGCTLTWYMNGTMMLRRIFATI